MNGRQRGIAVGVETPFFLLWQVSTKNTKQLPGTAQKEQSPPAQSSGSAQRPRRPAPAQRSPEAGARTHSAGSCPARSVPRLLWRCSPELQVTSGKLEAAGSKRPLPLPQQDAAGMLAAGHHHADPDPGPTHRGRGAGGHSASGSSRGRK